MILNVWIIVGFGLFKGLWKTALPLLVGTFLPSVSTPFPKPPFGTVGMEVSGLLTLVGGLVVLYAAWRLILARRRTATESYRGQTTMHRDGWLAANSRTARMVSLIVAFGVWLGHAPQLQGRAVAHNSHLQADTDASTVPDDTVIKIGVVAPTQGPAGILGNSFLKSIHLAKEELTNTKHRYDLVIEAIPSPDQAEPAIRALIETERVNALIVAMSMSGEIIKPYAAAAKIPMFCICSVGSLGDELYTFTTMPLAEDEATMWVAEAQRRGIRRIARFTQDFPSIDNHVKAMKAEAIKAGIEFVYEERFAPTKTDFRSEIANAQRSSPDVYYVDGFNPTLDFLGQQLRDAGVSNMASVVAFSVSEKPELFEGGWYTDSYVSPAFKVRLDQRYPDTRLATHMMPYAYDSYKILVDGFESGQDVLTYVRTMTEFNGTAGRITKKAGTGNFRSAPAVWVIKNGKPALLAP